MTSLEDLIRDAVKRRYTTITIDSAHGAARVSTWRANSKRYIQTYDPDPIVALRKALDPNDLSEFLS